MQSVSGRLPSSHLAQVEVRVGVDPSDPIVRRLLPSGLLAILVETGDCCPTRRPLAGGGVITIQDGLG